MLNNGFSKEVAVFSLVLLTQIDAGASAENIGTLLTQLLNVNGYSLGKSKQLGFVATKDGEAISPHDSPLTRPHVAGKEPTPLHVVRIEESEEGNGDA